MKKYILTFLFLFQFFNSFGQILDCPVKPNEGYKEFPNITYSRRNLNAEPQTDIKYVFNVRFHIIKNSDIDGVGTTENFGEEEVMNAIMILNTTFNQYNIYFKYKGFDVIKNTQLMKIRSMIINTTNSPTFDDLITYSMTTNRVYDFAALNIFIVDKINESSVTLQAQTAGLGENPGRNTVFGYNHFLTATLPHEIGHNFNLFHIYEGYNTSSCEHVSGDNSAVAGDLVADTPASRPISEINLTSSCGFVNNASVSDCLGVQYNNVPVKNFMGSWNTCRQLGSDYLPGNAEFTTDQANRMRSYLFSTNILPSPYNTIESLYEPFEILGMSGPGDAISSSYSRTAMTNHDNTGVNFTYTPNGIVLRFQKGFVTNFSTSTMATTQSVSQQYNFTNGSMFLNVQIPILGNETYQVGGFQSFSLFEPFTSGDIKSMIDLSSSNYTVEELDSIEASNPKLYDELQSGKYHIITKITDSGYLTQKTIYKN